MDTDEDDIQVMDGDTWNYLDGTPAQTPDDGSGTGFIEKTIADVVNLLNPLSWFRKKPSSRPPIARKRETARRTGGKPLKVQRPPTVTQNDRPAKRMRADKLEFGQLNLDEYPSDPPKNGLPPNINFSADERPSTSSKSSGGNITEDEDSDVEMTGMVTPGKKERKFGSARPDFSIPVRNTPSVSVARSPLVEQRRNQPRSPQWTTSATSSSARKSNVLPIVTPVKSNASQLVTNQLRSPQSQNSSASKPSRKRGFAEVDPDDETPTKPVPSNFPKTAERKSAILGSASKTINRFQFGRPASDSLNRSIAPQPINAMKRYVGTTNLPAVAFKSQIPPPKPVSFKISDTYNPPKPLPTSMSIGEGENMFKFTPVAVVPSGALAKALENSVDRIVAQETKKTTPVKTCRTCGIPVKTSEDHCDVCMHVEKGKNRPAPASLPSTSGFKPTQVEKPKEAEKKDADVMEPWKCDLCDKVNLMAKEKCERCHCVKAEMEKRRAKLEEMKRKKAEENAVSKPAETTSKVAEATQPTAVLTQKKPEEQKKKEEAPKSDEPSGFKNIWAQKPTGWSCGECFSQNKEDADTCAACSNPKPGSAPKKQAVAPTFQFGAPAGGLAAPTAASTTSSGVPAFTFGSMTATTSAASGIPAPGTFSFGSGMTQTTSTAPSVAPTTVTPASTSAASGTSMFGGFISSAPSAAAPASGLAAAPTTGSEPVKPAGFGFGGFQPSTSTAAPASTTGSFFGDLGKKPETAAPTQTSIFSDLTKKADGATGGVTSAPAPAAGAPTTSADTFGGFGGMTGGIGSSFGLPAASAPTMGGFVRHPASITGGTSGAQAATTSSFSFSGIGNGTGFGGNSVATNGIGNATDTANKPSGIVAPGFTFGAAAPPATGAFQFGLGGSQPQPGSGFGFNAPGPTGSQSLFSGMTNPASMTNGQGMAVNGTHTNGIAPSASQSLPNLGAVFGMQGTMGDLATIGGGGVPPPSRKPIVRAKRTLHR